jgi:hypothetical protein
MVRPAFLLCAPPPLARRASSPLGQRGWVVFDGVDHYINYSHRLLTYNCWGRQSRSPAALPIPVTHL